MRGRGTNVSARILVLHAASFTNYVAILANLRYGHRSHLRLTGSQFWADCLPFATSLWLRSTTARVRFGSKADICAAKGMSALASKADMCGALAHVRYGPIADIAYEIRGLSGFY